MVIKFSGKFAIIMFKKHRKFCRCGLTHLDATPTFKNRPNTYDTPCKSVLGLSLTVLVLRLLANTITLYTPGQLQISPFRLRQNRTNLIEIYEYHEPATLKVYSAYL
jgi:hypothetical protein